jgi:hypothetical protein
MLRGRHLRRSPAVAVAVAALAALVGAAAPATGRVSASFEGARLVVASDPSFGFTDIRLDLGDSANDAPGTAAHVSLTVPAGYKLDLSGHPGDRVADLIGILDTANGATDSQFVSGTIVVDDPATYAADPVAQACAPGTHTAYWRASLTELGRQIPFPIAIDAHDPADATASYTIQYCPFAPPSDTFPLGISLTTSDIFFSTAAAPTQTGSYRWTALVTPATPGPLTPDPGSAFELRASVLVPHVLTLKAAYQPKSHTAVLTGRLSGGGQPRAGVAVFIFTGELSISDRAVARTAADGTFTLKRKVEKTTEFYASVSSTSGPCVDATTAPGGCLSDSTAGTSSPPAVVVLPRKTDPKVATTARDQALARRSVLTVSDLPGAQIVGDPPPPCAAFAPDLHRLTTTGQRTSSQFLTADRNAALYATASVFANADDAKADFKGVATRKAEQCEANDIADGVGAHVGRIQQMTLPSIGDQVRGFRARLSDPDLPELTVDTLFVRANRVVITVHVESLGPITELERFLLRVLAIRAAH